jgi:hypothetical protein
MDIALFFAAGTLVGGTVAPELFGRLIDTGSRTKSSNDRDPSGYFGA